MSFLIYFDVEGCRSLLGDVHYFSDERQIPSIKDIVVETAVGRIVHIEIEALDHLQHTGLGGKSLDLIINIGIGAEQAELRERVAIAGYGTAT